MFTDALANTKIKQKILYKRMRLEMSFKKRFLRQEKMRFLTYKRMRLYVREYGILQ